MDKQRLQRKIEEQQKKWDTLSEKLSRLEQERILETRTDEKLRLEYKIDEIKTERQQVEEELDDLEAKLRDVRSTPTKTEEKRKTVVKDEFVHKKQQEADKKAEADHRLEKEKRLSQEFEFNVVTVNARGDITQIKRSTARQLIEDLGNGVLLEMVYIPSGMFLMGQTEVEKEHLIQQVGGKNYKALYINELPQHQVTVAPFYMGKFPVSQEQWETVMGTNPSEFKGAKRPVNRASWEDAVKFCNQLSLKTDCVYRLPSEAEWEYACRAGTTTPFHFGETITTDLANYNGGETYASALESIYHSLTLDVGTFPPNAFGLYDMHGYVWEWCADPWHKNYEGAPSDGSVWEMGGNTQDRVLRGGSWSDHPADCRSANRYKYLPGRRHSIISIGFRVVVGSVVWTP